MCKIINKKVDILYGIILFKNMELIISRKMRATITPPALNTLILKVYMS